ncbi:hypothetical protein B0T21DRAFT_353792 [Apiosordaria backusii]|uniref:Uncharacterized protein n=1 Tax=Apiosordaria backusii TaxID=314023 RepID=A0AA40DF70_9PEZI|nr:hypothetical protein B0T21DRAFT_353792 [Apiosordaria backusii]
MAFVSIPAGILMVGILWAGSSGNPRPEQPHGTQRVQPGEIRSLPVGSIGWTQDSVRPLVYNVASSQRVPLLERVTAALNDYRGAAAYLREAFPEPITVFYHDDHGFLSIDNRRLTVIRLALAADTLIPVRIVTREEAGRLLARNRDGFDPNETLAQRLTTRDGGYSIIIRGNPRTVVSQGTCYIPSPFVLPDHT